MPYFRANEVRLNLISYIQSSCMEILSSLDSPPRFVETRRLSGIYLDTAFSRKDMKLKSYGERLGLCGQHAFVQYRQNDIGTYDFRNVYYHCNLRQCPSCTKKKNQPRREMIEQMLLDRGSENFIFLTNTMPKRYSVDGCREQFDFLSTALSKLTRIKMYKIAVKGTFRALEGNSKEDGMVNPHGHSLLELYGKDLRENKTVLKYIYEDKDFLKVFYQYLLNTGMKVDELYSRILRRLKRGRYDQLIWSSLFIKYGLGSICYVKEVRDYKGGVYGVSGELCKYLTKSMAVSDSSFVDFYSQMQQKKLFTASGSIRKYFTQYVLDKKEEKENEEEQNDFGEWRYYGGVKEIAVRAFTYGMQPDIQAFVVMVKDNLIDSEFIRNFKLNRRV